MVDPKIIIEQEIANSISEYLKGTYLHNWGVGQDSRYYNEDDYDIKITILTYLSQEEIKMVRDWSYQVYGL